MGIDFSKPLNVIIVVVTVALIVIMIGEYIARKVVRNSQFNKLQRLLANQEYEEFHKLMDSRVSRWVFPEYNRKYFKLNAYIMQDDFTSVYQLLDELLQARVDKNQRTDLVYKAFNIYISQDDRERSSKMLKEIKTWEDEKLQPIKRECVRTYDIFILGKSNYIDEMEGELKELKGQARGRMEHLIAMQYDNLGNAEKRDEYLRRAVDDSFTSPSSQKEDTGADAESA